MDIVDGVGTWAKVPAGVATDLSAGAVHLYAVLALHADRTTHQCYPGRKRLAAMTRCSTRTVDRLLAELAAAGAVTRTHRGKPGAGRDTTLYTLTTGRTWAKVPETLVLDGTHRAVALYALLDVMADRNGIAEPPRARLAELLDCSTDSVDRALAELAAAGLVTRLPQVGKVTRLRLPHRRPEGEEQTEQAAPRPSAPVAVNPSALVAHEPEPLNQNSLDDLGNRERAVSSPRPSSEKQKQTGDRWHREVWAQYARLALADATTAPRNPAAWCTTVARTARTERGDRLDALRAEHPDLTPSEAAAALHDDGPVRRPPPGPVPAYYVPWIDDEPLDLATDEVRSAALADARAALARTAPSTQGRGRAVGASGPAARRGRLPAHGRTRPLATLVADLMADLDAEAAR